MITFTQITGSTASTSPSTYGNAFTTLCNNNSQTAVTFGQAQANNYHRFLIQKYFDNERTFSIPVVGPRTLTFTGSLAQYAVSATMTTTWPKMTCTQQVTFSTGDMRICSFTNGLATITWNVPLPKAVTSSASALGVRDYPIPANISKITNGTVTVGELVFQPFPTQSRQEWDMINTIPYGSDIPNYFFIYGGTMGIWPIPSTDYNPLTFNYKARVPDLSFQDYSTGNVTAMTQNSFQVTGSSTTWSSQFPLNVDVSYFNLMLRVNPPNGDGMWYPISSFQSDTALTLALPVVNAPNITGSSTYTIGQMPLLQEDFHDTIIYGILMSYYTTIGKDPDRFKIFKDMYETRLLLMEDYLGTKSIQVDLEDTVPLLNPNLMPYKTSIN
jgi:hypothetical protein